MPGGSYMRGDATPAVKDSSETGTIVEGIALTRDGVSDTPVLGLGERQPVKIAGAGDNFYGVAFADPDLTEGLAAVHLGIVKMEWLSTGTALAVDDPVKIAAGGLVDLWVGGTDYADMLIGFVETPVPGGTDYTVYIRLGVR